MAHPLPRGAPRRSLEQRGAPYLFYLFFLSMINNSPLSSRKRFRSTRNSISARGLVDNAKAHFASCAVLRFVSTACMHLLTIDRS